MRPSAALNNLDIRKLSQELFSSLKDAKSALKLLRRIEDGPELTLTGSVQNVKRSILLNTIDRTVDSELKNNSEKDISNENRLTGESNPNSSTFVFYNDSKIKLNIGSLSNKLYSATSTSRNLKNMPSPVSRNKQQRIPVSLSPSVVEKYHHYLIKSPFDKSNVLEFKSQNPFLIKEDFFKLLRNLSIEEQHPHQQQLSSDTDCTTLVKSKQFDHSWKMLDFQLIKKRDPKFLEFDNVYYLKFPDFPTACGFLVECTNELIEGLPATFSFFNVKNLINSTNEQDNVSNMAISQLGEYLHVEKDTKTNGYIIDIRNKFDLEYQRFFEKGMDPKNILRETVQSQPDLSEKAKQSDNEIPMFEKIISINNDNSGLQNINVISQDQANLNLQKFELKTPRNHCAVVYNLPYVYTSDDLLLKIFWEFDLFPVFQNSLILLNNDPKVWLVVFDNDRDPKRFQRAYNNKWWNEDKTHPKVFVDVLDY